MGIIKNSIKNFVDKFQEFVSQSEIIDVLMHRDNNYIRDYFSKTFELFMSKKTSRESLRLRWLSNSLYALLTLVVTIVTIFAMTYSGYCYNSVKVGLESEVKTTSDFLSNYASNEKEYLEMANYYLSDFEYRDRIVLQFLNSDGQVLLSSGIDVMTSISGTKPGTPDITNAIQTKGVSSWSGDKSDTGEHVVAVSSPIIIDGEIRGIIRMVTSLVLVDRQIVFVTILIFIIAAFIVTFICAINMFFITNSVITPIEDITQITKNISEGSYGTQIVKDHNDEVGVLIDAINNMSEKIRQNESMKFEFISSISHELRTPLTAINGWSETLLAGEVDDAESMEKGLQIISSEGKRLAKLVEELLEFSRMQDGRFTLSIEQVDIKSEFEDAIFTYRQFYIKKNIKLSYKDYDESDLELIIPADPNRMRQVFSNILDNAAKHGGENQLIETSIAKVENHVIITIRDHGKGIAAKDLPHVKEMFYKATSKVRGSGIGLSVCDEIVSLHGGKLSIDNAKGGGCVVQIKLPLKNK